MQTKADNRLSVLGILNKNLQNPQPQVVSINTIANELKIGTRETRQLLLQMDQAGEIQSDIDGNYSLITPAGLFRLNCARNHALVENS